MSISLQIAVLTAGALVWMGGFYAWGRLRRDMGTIDVAWTYGIALAAVTWLFLLDGYGPRMLTVALLAVIWSGRLGTYILRNRVLRGPEDGRYRDLRAHWGDRQDRNFLLLFEFEALLVVLFALPLLGAMTAPADHWRWLDTLGVVIWLVAVGGESLADRQLSAFLSREENRGSTCRRGLWRYSRHPNYFFEWVHWWAYVAFAAGSPYFWMTLLGPVLMYVFLVHLTGIPHVERRARQNRSDFAEYEQTTSRFFPWPPKKNPS